MSGGSPEILDVALVMQRYGIRDRRAARRLMDEAGGFLMAGRLLVRRDDLEAYESRQREARRKTSDGGDGLSGARTSVSTRPLRTSKKPLSPGWWRHAAED